MELESKLLAYRAKKNREAKLNHLKDTFKKVINWNKPKTDCSTSKEQQEPLIEPEIENNINNEVKPSKKDVKIQEPLEEKPKNKAIQIAIYVTGFITWASLYYFFIKAQFGIIYLIVSALFGIYFNTRTGPKAEGEVSAYSVFNENCESIDGTLKAEQFEREIRYGGLT